MTIEQAIASYEKSAERHRKAFLHCKAHGGEFYQEEAESNKICYEHDRQLAEWLRELQERRKEPEVIKCGECIYRYVEGNHVRFNRCELNHNNVQSDDWYCRDAERRTDGT